jgi:hypothetical protein
LAHFANQELVPIPNAQLGTFASSGASGRQREQQEL